MAMAELMMYEPFELYNLLNQCSCVSRLAEINYLCLIDARETRDYGISHIITAKSVKMDSAGAYIPPEAVELDTMQHIVVYDSDTSCLQGRGRAVECARVLAQASLCPVHVVRGGFQRFSALYPFLRTEKILYTITELEELKMYPVEVIAGRLYMGDQKQRMDSGILTDLKISAVVHISDTPEATKGNQTILNIPTVDSVGSDLFSNFERICSFIASQIQMGSRVLVVSKRGRSRCSAATVAFLMHHLKCTLEASGLTFTFLDSGTQEAWKHLMKCKPSMRPNTGFLQQLSDWELHTIGTKVTDISEPHF